MNPNTLNNIESLIITLRNQKVILDSDVATIYGVETRDINQAVKNNLAKFLQGYVFVVTKNELEDLRWNVSTAKLTKTRVLPKALTEKGLYMLATILKSQQATKATLQIIETFAKVREFSRVAKSLASEQDKKQNSAKQKSLTRKSGELIGDILNQEFAQDTSSETTIELNLAMIKIKHTIKKDPKKTDKKKISRTTKHEHSTQRNYD